MVARLVAAACVIAATIAFAGAPPLQGDAGATEHDRPNVLIFVTDDQRLDGTMAALPSVARWFGEQGTEYPNGFATTPLCCPSRASILTGRYPHNHKVTHNGQEARAEMDFDRTLPAFFKAAGYRTGLFGKFFNRWPATVPPPHFDRWVMSGAGYFNARFNIQGRIRRLPRYSTKVVSNRASNFMHTSIDAGTPWFMYVAPVAAHDPFRPELAYADAWVPPRPRDASLWEEDLSDKPPWVSQREPMSPERVRDVYRGQLRTLMSVDDMVDRLFTELEARGEADDTVAVFTSDNGFLWGEHNLGRKKYPYLPSIRVPLFVRWPAGVDAAARDARLAANIDIAPTVLDAAGVETDETFDGMSLLDPLERDSLFLEYASISTREGALPSWDAIVHPDRHYIVYRTSEGTEVYREYYDLAADPAELTNLLGDEDDSNDPPAPLVEALHAQIELGRSCSGSSCWIVP